MSFLTDIIDSGGYVLVLFTLLIWLMVFTMFVFITLKKARPEAKGNKKSISNGYQVTLFSKRLINKSEEDLFYAIKRFIADSSIDAHVFTQVSYGEFIGTKGKDAFAAFNTFNSKRADFVIVDYEFNPVVVVEYHGEGHFKGTNMEKSDGIKYAACKAAGIKHLVIHFREKKNLNAYLESHLLPLIANHAKGF